ncbi:AAA family ATPase [Corynebacterium matruchotii]|uniref:ATPase AAA-type core domain-containing protein n=1 Tax=Corynebacterium matruchotii ATCC 33806 TaxID=566549 RepID=C0E5R4_9CORY|nr:ATP-binding protein [Corynebacterium matruchotii]EEG26113.1 hypothetical protein CORMATOL_02346 [Corynebacterium matruchotii ATCC 33806]
MLLSFTVENYRSFAHETTLDMQSPKFQTLRPRENESWNDLVLKRAAIFGANASGKTNIIKPLGMLRNAIASSIRNEELVKSLYDPHKLYKDDPTTFITEYEYKGIRYRWTLVLDKAGIVEESLQANAKRIWRPIFDRKRDTIVFGKGARIPIAAQENINQFLKPTALCFSAWSTIKNPGRFIGAVYWWKNKMRPPIHASDPDRKSRHYWVMKLASQNINWLKLLKLIMTAADVGITDVSVKKEEALSESLREFLIHLEKTQAKISGNQPQGMSVAEYLQQYIEFHHEGDSDGFVLKEEDESRGTQVWIDSIVPALYALYHGALLIVDELDSSLHPTLLREFIHYFQDEEINTQGAQLIFTTHDLTLLGNHPTEALDRNEVWFVEKQQSISELIALSEFSSRDNHNIEKRYLQGVFGAVPITSSRGIAEALDGLRAATTETEA